MVGPPGWGPKSDPPRVTLDPRERVERLQGCVRSARAREPEIDLRGARVRPARRDDLRSRVELDAFGAVHVQVPEEAVLPASEAVIGDRHGDRHVDADHPRVHLELELPSSPAIAGEDRRAVAVWVRVDEVDRL